MRIAYVCADPGVPVFGAKGCSVHVQEILRAFRQWGARVELFATRLGGEPPSDLRDIPVHPLSAIPKGPQAFRERAALDSNRELRDTLTSAERFDLVYERYSLWSFAGMEFAQDAGVPGLLEVNAPLIEEQAAYRGLSDRAAAEEVAGRTFAAASALLGVSRPVGAWLETYPEAHGRIHLVSNGVNVARFSAVSQAALPAPSGWLTVGFVGSLKPWHGLSVLIEAFALVKQHASTTRLLIVGDGPERDALAAEVRDRGLAASVILTGSVPPADVPGMLASMDVAVAPYPPKRNFYFSPLKISEYMAAGLPTVASRVGEVPELIEDGVNGLLTPPGESVPLADQIVRLLRERGLRERLGRQARETVRSRHTWRIVAQRILHLASQSVPTVDMRRV